MKQNFHALDEFFRRAIDGGLNPGDFWSFGSEGLGGRVGKIAAIVHPSTMSHRTLERWLVAFFSELRS